MLSVIQPPSSGPITGATSVVIAHIAIARAGHRRRVARQQQRLRQRDHRPGDQRPAARGTRSAISMLGARPHSHDASTNSSTLAVNRRTWPKRCVSQPVSGTEIALATANDVMTQVPCVGLTPRSPAIAGIDTLAIDVSSTFMKVASDSTERAERALGALQRRNAKGRGGGAAPAARKATGWRGCARAPPRGSHAGAQCVIDAAAPTTGAPTIGDERATPCGRGWRR